VSRRLPWRRPRYELALLALVAVAALTPIHDVNAQDSSRLCVTGALEHGRLAADDCLALVLDKSWYAGHYYTDKAPGMSAIELPFAELVRLRSDYLVEPRLWAVRVLSSGLAFLICAFMLGRVAEGLAPGCGGATLVAFALGTLATPFAAANFGNVCAGALGFGAFLLAWTRRDALAGLLAGAAVLVEYQAAGIAVIVGAYVAVRGLARLGRYVAGAVPGIAILLAYNAAAFGAPWHFSYRYLANGFVFQQNEGVFGVGLPKAYSTYEVFAGAGGLLVVSPVLIAACWGLVLLARSHRREALVCAAVALFFLVVNCGYFLPYGGISPGARFVVPALPFLALGLAPAFAWRPRITALLTALSVVPMIGLTLVWSGGARLHRTIWWELARVPVHGRGTRFVGSLTANILHWLGAGRIVAATVVAIAAACAFVLALRSLPRGPRISSRAAIVVVASFVAIAAADASALTEYPYTTRRAEPPALLYASLTATKVVAVPGDEVDFTASVFNPQPAGATGAIAQITLSAGLSLLGPPAVERGPGCSGTTEIACDLDFVDAQQTTPIRFAVRVRPGAGDQETVSVIASSNGARGGAETVTLRTGGG
jgi:hypothetical protein